VSADPHIIGIGAVVSGRAEYDAAQARVERLKAEAEAERWQWNPLHDLGWMALAFAVILLCALLPYALGAFSVSATPTAPAAAIPCPGPGLNEHTYIVLANDAGQIRMQSCTTVHILGR
jgi:hypothetical protein